jgi:hypothetical protein
MLRNLFVADDARDRHILRLSLAVATVFMLICLTVVTVGTRSWPLISDAVLIRYANHMLQSGMAPYRQLIDINLPGSYLIDSLATSIFGLSAAGWRAFDLALMLVAIAAMAWVARRSGNSSIGICVGTLFALLHIADGAAQMGQRDLVVGVILLCGFAGLTGSTNRTLRVRLLVYGLSCGSAGTIKPTALLFVSVALPILFIEWRRNKAAVFSPLLLLLAGTAFPEAVLGIWLWRKGSFAAFVETAGGLMRYHNSMARHTIGFLLGHAIPTPIIPLLIPGLVMLFLYSDWRRLEQQMALIGISCGLISFCIQGKAYPYHRYPLLAFMLLLLMLELESALNAHRARKRPLLEVVLSLFIIGYGALWLGPVSVVKALRYDWRSQPALFQLQADLTALAPTLPAGGLNKTVQCLDTMAGCITVLNRMHLLQSTGFIYDCYLFAPGANPVEQDQRRHFIAQLDAKPPRVFIVTNQWCLNLPNGYKKLDQWPQFSAYLHNYYTLVLERSWRVTSKKRLATWPFGYRLYVLKSVKEMNAGMHV